tara:strand:+ start:518 stop:772 length:255 start_codon:yes stop_codon:yes gene_type:complete
MDNTDVLYLIIKNRTLCDNIKNCAVNKIFYEITKLISFEQISKLYYFKKFKKKTLFPKKIKLKHTYYTLKNMYINKEERPILFF